MNDQNNQNGNGNGNNNPNRRYIGKKQVKSGQYGSYEKVLVDNPNPTLADGSPNPYYRGSLMWFDAQTQQYYQVKQIGLRGVSEDARQKGFNNSLTIDLDNEYEVTKLQK